MMSKKELKDITAIVVFVVLFITVTNFLPYTPLGDNLHNYKTNSDTINVQHTYVTINFNDEFTVSGVSNFYIAIKSYQTFTIKRDLRTISDLQIYLKQGYIIANYSVTLVTYRITSDVKGTSVLVQDFLVQTFLGNVKIRETKFSGTQQKLINLRYAENDLIISGYDFNLTFYLELFIQSLQGDAYLTVSDISVQLLITLTTPTEAPEEPLPQPEDDSNIETSPSIPLAYSGETGSPTEGILPYSWLIVIMDYGVIYSLLISLLLVVGIIWLWKKLRKIKH